MKNMPTYQKYNCGQQYQVIEQDDSCDSNILVVEQRTPVFLINLPEDMNSQLQFFLKIGKD